MATNFSPFKGSCVLNQFPSNVMFGMNGFHVSASGAIQGHHGPLVFFLPTTAHIYVDTLVFQMSYLSKFRNTSVNPLLHRYSF